MTSTPTPTAATPSTYRLTFGRVIRSEWIKQRTLRSTWVGLVAAVLILVGIAAIASGVSTGSVSTPDAGPSVDTSDPLTTVLTGANFGVLLLGVLGCLAGAREYGSRMITATIAAVPHRWQVVSAKAIVLIAAFLPTALAGVFAAFFVGMSILKAGNAETVSLWDDGIVRSVVGMAAYLTAIALLGLALGVLLRSVAASIGVLVGVVLVVPGIAGALLPASWDEVLQLLPTNAAGAFTAVNGSAATTLSATGGAVVLLTWVVAALLAATVAINRRDV